MLPCRRCVECLAGTRHCLDRSIGGFPTYSQLPLSIEPSLWGGYSTHLYLHPFTVLHRVSESLSAPAAAMFNPIGNGFQWAVFTPDLKVGQSALVFGPGQRGLASVLALRTAGAGQVLVTGLSRDSAKLNLAREFGADHTIDVENEDVAEVVRGATDGRGVDVVIDTTPGAPDNLVEAIGHVRVGGTIVAPGLKHKPVEGLMTDQVIGKELTIKGVLSASSTAFEQAIRLIESDRFPLDKMLTHSFPLESAESAINTLAGRSENGDSICVSIVMT